MRNYKLICTILSLILSIQLDAQDLLTPEEAVTMAISNNFDIAIAKNESEIAKINNHKGAAGMLPKINVTTGDVFNLNNINQKFTSGTDVVRNWVPVNSFNASLNLNWTVFDGLKMFATKDRLQALQSIGEMQLKEQIQNTMAQVLNIYYEVVRQKQQLKALQESAKISEERVKVALKKYEVGYSDKTPLLQARVDLTSQQINILKQEALLQQSKAQLNQLLSRDASVVFEVIDTIQVSYIPNLQQIKDTALTQHFSILRAKKYADITRLQHKEIKSQRMPSINFNTGYGFTQNNSKAGFQIFNRTYGPTVGVNAIIPIYNGGTVKKELAASAVDIATQEIKVTQLKIELETKIITAFRNHDYALKMLKLNEENVAVADENVKIALERFRLNQSNSVEMKQAQSSYEEALYSVIAARYGAKIAEIELRKWSNDLIK
ncbi:MAG: TolC family protein [Sphingobacteriales bacterium]|jgi:outer membrane protein|nr:TolC family protein [Sphingobacteriales bacterium]